MTRLDASDLATRLGRKAETVCRYYLDAGRRQGNYCQIGVTAFTRVAGMAAPGPIRPKPCSGLIASPK